jgi:uncharacterized protein YcgI (DUF1989 family)
MSASKFGKPRLSLTLEPITGKALPVYKGEVLRITQLEGEQTVDFNCFNLNDYKEYMSVGHMRREGFRLQPNRFIWSNPPRFRPMMKVLKISTTCITDMLAARCSAVQMEVHYGLDDHPNCQDTLAEAIGEFGLTPDDTHDSLNFWQNTKCDHIGYYNNWNVGRPGDSVELLATMDVLAVPVVCGSGNLWITSNFSYKPIAVEILEATKATTALAEQNWKEYCSLKTQRKVDDFRQSRIRTEPELKRDPTYQPAYVNFPIEWKEIEVEFSSDEFRSLWHLRGVWGESYEEVVRTLFFHWYLDNRKRRGWRFPTPTHSEV